MLLRTKGSNSSRRNFLKDEDSIIGIQVLKHKLIDCKEEREERLFTDGKNLKVSILYKEFLLMNLRRVSYQYYFINEYKLFSHIVIFVGQFQQKI